MRAFFHFRRKLLPVYILLLVILAMCIAGNVYVSGLAKQNIYIYYNNRIQTDSIQTIVGAVIIGVIGTFCVTAIRHKVIKVISATLCAGLLLALISLSTFFNDNDKKIFEFYSPDDSHVILVEEWTWLMGGGADVYQKTGDCFVTRLDEIVTDDGYRPFSNRDYSLEWSEKAVHIEYGFGNSARKDIKVRLK